MFKLSYFGAMLIFPLVHLCPVFMDDSIYAKDVVRSLRPGPFAVRQDWRVRWLMLARLHLCCLPWHRTGSAYLSNCEVQLTGSSNISVEDRLQCRINS
jgi:hypothetical protein